MPARMTPAARKAMQEKQKKEDDEAVEQQLSLAKDKFAEIDAGASTLPVVLRCVGGSHGVLRLCRWQRHAGPR